VYVAGHVAVSSQNRCPKAQEFSDAKEKPQLAKLQSGETYMTYQMLDRTGRV